MLSNFTIKRADGVTDVTYQLQGTTQESASYIDQSGTTLSAPRIVSVKHSLKPIGSQGSDRHTVLAQAVVVDSNNVPYVCSASLTWTVPRLGSMSENAKKDVLAAVTNYLAMAGVTDALIDGIIP